MKILKFIGNNILYTPTILWYTLSMKAKELPQTLLQAVKYFANEDLAHDYVVQMRWGDTPKCITCGSENLSYIQTRKIWKCLDKECVNRGKQFSATKGTVFERTHIKLGDWMVAIWMITNNKNGKSSYELSRDLGITQKSAWFMNHRIREIFDNGTIEKLKGTVEVDETFVGGKAKNMHKAKREAVIQGRGATGKAIVMGMLERSEEGSKVEAKVIPDTTKLTLHTEIVENVEQGANLNTDGFTAYQGLDSMYEHGTVNHAYGEYVNGSVHTNGIENFWTLFKRSINGTYVSVEDEHLDRYVTEQEFRYNTRKGSDYERFEAAMKQLNGKRLTYDELTDHEPLRGA